MKSPIAVSALCAVLFLGFSATAQADPLAGTWSGRGYSNPKEGVRENVRCQITYRRESEKVYGVLAVCASTSAKIRQTGEVLKVSSKRYVGDFYNSAYDVSGRVRVTLSGSRQTVTFSGAKGSGRVTLTKR